MTAKKFMLNEKMIHRVPAFERVTFSLIYVFLTFGDSAVYNIDSIKVTMINQNL